MIDLADLPGFEHGYPPQDPKWYGLWCPLLDCFIMVSYDLKRLKQTQALTVSKILTVLVQLDPNLYLNNVIDNSCAANWTLRDTEAINFTLVLKKEFSNNIVSDLEPSNTDDPTMVKEIQSWFWFVWQWISNLDNLPRSQFNDTVGLVFDFDISNYRKQIYKILLLEHDIEQARNKIVDLFRHHA